MRKLGSFKLALAMSCASLFSGGAAAQPANGVTEFEPGVYAVPACSMDVPSGHARCHSWIVTDAAGQVKKFTDPNGLHPDDLRSAYKVKATGSSDTLIAIVDAFHYINAESDLGVYRSTFGIPACTKANGCFMQVDQNGGQNFGGTDPGWNDEEALDLDMASAMCPNCKILAVEANTNSYANLATAVKTAARLGAHVISNSYGGSEGGTQSYESAYNQKGVAVTASTGDAGFKAGPQFPATSPHVIAVGGTYLKTDTNARGWTETAWPGAGSGCSTVYPKPAWQTDPSCSMRMEADVSAVASPGSPVAVYGPVNGGSGWFTTGGTSVAAPLVGGIYGANGGTVKYASRLYAHTDHLYDVTAGSNGTCNVAYYCTAGVGYDGPTGLGTPKGIKAF